MYITAGSSDILSVFFIQLIISVTPIVADVGILFVKSPEPFAGPLRDDVFFDCSLNLPAEAIRWRHGRKYIQQNRTTSSRTSTTNQLTIKLDDETQLGDYQCVAYFGASAIASVPAKLSLAEMKPFPHQPEKHYKVTAGNMVSIFCPPPVSNPSAVIQYYRNDKKISSQHSRILPTSSSLLLQNVSEQDSGVYTCSATNYITSQTFNAPFRVILEVVPSRSVPQYPPKFLSSPQTNYVVQSGSNVTIECVAVGEPPPRVTWYKAGVTQALPKNRTDLLVGGLHLRNIVPEDTGEYVCEMNNGVSPPLQHKVLLHIHEAPVILKEPNKTQVEEHGNTELSCEVSGNPIPTVTWTLNAEPLTNDEYFTISSSKITIRKVQKIHAGIYQCFAQNSVGTTYGAAWLQVIPKQIIANGTDIFEQEEGWNEGGRNNRSGMPGNHNGHHNGKKERQRKNKSKRKYKENEIMVPPTRPNVTRLSDRSVMVRWHVPPNSGLKILFFKVQYKEVSNNDTGKGRSGNSRWMTSNEDIPPHIRSYEVDRLETNRYYKFRVAAVYENNDNKLSKNSNKFFLHQGVPTDRSRFGAPTFINSEALSSTSIQIQWQYSNTASTPVDGFYVYYRATSNAGDYIKATVEGEKTNSFVITHLQPDTSYDIKIQCFTVGAASDFSTIITRKTLADPTSTTTENASRGDLKTPNVSILPATSSSTFQLMLVFGGILGGLVIIFMIFVLVCFLKQRSPNDHSSDENTPDKNTDNIMTIHQVEPVTMNGYANHNNHNNHKIMNGSLKSCTRNGYITPHPPINITNNPLAPESKHEKNTMEMSYLSRHNNNCPMDGCVDLDGDCGREVKLSIDRTKWKLREQRPGEKYV
ncbi:interference hedgehog-like isoform X2 [Planococcus citri]|uniref:interference hedgehog-like isoform X2 n=1 Tax=Planococcus citri TaxID=170843 RepID=UPI0031F94B2C